jgi:hypothetical protein
VTGKTHRHEEGHSALAVRRILRFSAGIMRVSPILPLCLVLVLILVSCASPEGSATKSIATSPKSAKAPRATKPEAEPAKPESTRPISTVAGVPRSGPPSLSTNDTPRPDPIRPYSRVITKDAKTERGVFITHRVDDRYYFEIPTNQLGKDFLWVTQIARTQAGYGYGGGSHVGNRVVRWELRDRDILLRDVKFTIRADGTDSVRHAVEDTSVPAIIRKLPVACWGTNKAPVIDMTDFFVSDVAEFSAKAALNSSGADRSRSFIERIKTFPENIETKVTMTYAIGGGSAILLGNTNAPTAPTRRDSAQSAVTVLLHHSMVRLPEKPMQPRVHDARVGFFNVAFEDFATEEHQVKQVRFINRWRLEKQDPAAEISEPKKPIVFYIGRGVPDKWRPYIKRGVEAWQPAFEAAGFRNAILAKDAPSELEDPNWDAEDARYSTIQWLPSTIENAMGPHVHDPRTGEILESDILVYHNILKLTRDWYFVQASPMDPRAQKLPLPDDLMGELLSYVITHEIGHTLGFPHNMKGSSSYTVEQLRDPVFTKKYGTEASVMDYGRYNYVAQPGDGATLVPVIGPYDFFAIEWGYKQFKDAPTPAKEKPHLDQIAARQVDNAMLRFGDPNAGVDPSQQTEDLGSDAVKATELGLKNIARVAAFLISATCKEGQDYELLNNMYTQLLRQRDRELGHVASIVGGVVQNNLWFGQRDHVFDPVPADKQRYAVTFLLENGLNTPDYLVSPDILARIEPAGVADRILSSQRSLIATLLDDSRCKRMSEFVNRDANNSYSPGAMLADLRAGVFSELRAAQPEVNLYRRNLQRAFVEQLGTFASSSSASTDMPALARAELKRIQEDARKITTAKGEATVAHLADLVARIERIFEPKSGGAERPGSPRSF